MTSISSAGVPLSRKYWKSDFAFSLLATNPKYRGSGSDDCFEPLFVTGSHVAITTIAVRIYATLSQRKGQSIRRRLPGNCLRGFRVSYTDIELKELSQSGENLRDGELPTMRRSGLGKYRLEIDLK